jgi:hypothetical protein
LKEVDKALRVKGKEVAETVWICQIVPKDSIIRETLETYILKSMERSKGMKFTKV